MDIIASAPSSVIGNYGYRNLLRRNGGLEVWQRGAGGAASIAVAASSAGTYTADGWYLNTGALEASVVSQVAGLTYANGSQYAAKILRTAGQTGVVQCRFGYPLDTDEIFPMLGNFVALSFTAVAGANWSPASGTLIVRLTIGTGTPVKVSAGYTGSAAAIGNPINLTTTPTRYTFVTNAVIPTTTLQAEINVLYTPVGTAGADDSFSIDDVQLEVVSSPLQNASPFERLNFQEQLQLCKRHYQKTHDYASAPVAGGGVGHGEFRFAQTLGASTTQQASPDYRYPVPLRIPVTPVLYNPVTAGSNQIRGLSVNLDWTAAAVGAASPSSAIFSGTSPAGSPVGYWAAVHIVGDAGI